MGRDRDGRVLGVPLEAQDRYVRRADGTLELHTGDQGRLDADGLLYFLGRDDDMVKRRGVRIALSEIEHAAERVPGVYAAVAPRPADEDAPCCWPCRATSARTRSVRPSPPAWTRPGSPTGSSRSPPYR